ncbi:membrane glycoprotein UL139 [Human betaherpesvirus 5]|uniref:Membrane glycoprotein UL139 n=1 Tax=Human cytomegalovirus TaxID=10359 RepID=A0A0G2TJF7_HCMV|nr:membrane glycoprotein UL139 [Human betaherpesvirus 5]APG57489.1 membrane glycoprotein UL139 [Human betaherpesvirus 5]
MLWVLVLFALAASASETTTGTSSNSSQSTSSVTTSSTACINGSGGSNWTVPQLALLAASGWTLSGLLLLFTCCFCCFWLVRKICSCCGNSESESKTTHAYTNAAFTSSDATLPMGTTGSYTPPQDGSFPPPPR